MTAVLAVVSIPLASAQQIAKDYNDEEYRDVDRTRIDRYLDVEIWPNHSDGEYYDGDNVVLHYRTNRDAFVVIYSIDSRGRINLLFPSEPGEDNYVKAGVTYRLPDGLDDFDLVVTGPEGMENIQAIASRERFPVPDWYPTSGLICDWDDRHEYMDYLNERYFVRYDGQRFAYDRTAIYVNEWEEYYFQPVYYPNYYPWTVYGNAYIDYPFGASVYIDGFYWGYTPLYIPYLYAGWHTFTVYDNYGYCWESGIHVTRYHSVVLGHEVIRTSPTVVSKYKEVRFAGYRNPATNGYPNYKQKEKAIMRAASVSSKTAAKGDKSASKKTAAFLAGTKKHVRGSTKLVKTERGYETTGAVYGLGKGAKATRGGSKSSRSGKIKSSTYSGSKGSSTGGYSEKSSSSYPKSAVYGKKESSGNKSYQKTKSKSGSGSSKKSSGYYQKKSGSSYKGKSGAKRSNATYKGSKSKSGGKSYNSGKSTGSKSKGSAPSYRKSGGGSKSSGRSSSSMGGRSSGRSGSSGGSKSSGRSGSSGGSKSSGGKGKR